MSLSSYSEEIGAENGKKENRSAAGSIYKFEDFLNAYNTSDIYMVNDMPEGMKDEWPLPNFLLCGGYTEHMAYVNVWFSSGGTKSVLHSDSMENFHCVVSGRKEFIMFEPRYSQDIGPEHEQLGYYHIDVDSVDMLKYTNLSSIPWYKAVIDSGDCLYLPYHWLHQVNSYGRNLGVNVWWIPFQFNEEECEDIPHVAGFATISQFQTTPELQVR
jgi:lysine-specific demethylase 8